MKTKRIAAGLLAAVMALGLVACGDVDESSSKAKSKTADSKESSSVVETEKSSEKEESSEADSADDNSSEADDPDKSNAGDGYEFGLSLLGMERDSARELIKSTYPDTKEDTEDFQTENPVTVYTYNGDVAFLGKAFESMHFSVDENTGKVISAAFVAKGTESGSLDELYKALGDMTTEKYGEGQYSKSGDDELSNEFTLWDDGHISVQYMHSASQNSSILSLAFEENPMQIAPTYANDPDSVEQLAVKYQGTLISDAEKLTQNVFGSGYEQKDVGEVMNALGKMAQKTSYCYSDAFSLLGEEFRNVNIDYDVEDKTVYTVGVNKNTDINTDEGYNPTVAECEESYNNLYALFRERYGEPDVTFVPEQYKYNGALWKNTPAGEVWIAWGDKIFGSEQADCVMSFSVSGISGTD